MAVYVQKLAIDSIYYAYRSVYWPWAYIGDVRPAAAPRVTKPAPAA